MKSPEELRKILKSGEVTVGTWLQFPSPDVAEMMAKSGYDWVAIDMEHGSFGPVNLPNIIRAIECGGAAPFVRLPEAEKVWIKTALEAGATGLVFPMIESGEQLARAIDLATYPGQDYWRENGVSEAYRGVGFCRANSFGKNFNAYHDRTAKEILLVAQIEHVKALANLDDILSHPRLDAIMVGPYDLSGSMGITGQFQNLKFKEAMDAIEKKCREYEISVGTHVVTPDPAELIQAKNRGYQFIAYGIDTVFLWQAAKRPE